MVLVAFEIISNITDAAVNAAIRLGLPMGGIMQTMFMPGGRGFLVRQVGNLVRRGLPGVREAVQLGEHICACTRG